MKSSGDTNIPRRDKKTDEGRLQRLPGCLTGTGNPSVYDVRHTLMFVKGEQGLSFILSRWSDLSETAKIHLFDITTRDEIVACAPRIVDVLSKFNDSVPVLSAITKKLCFTGNVIFKDALSRAREYVDESVRRDIDSYLTRFQEARVPATSTAETKPAIHQRGKLPANSHLIRVLVSGLCGLLMLVFIVAIVLAEIVFLSPRVDGWAIVVAIVTLMVWMIFLVWVGSVTKTLPPKVATSILKRLGDVKEVLKHLRK